MDQNKIISFKKFITEGFADIIKDEEGAFVFINPRGEKVLRIKPGPGQLKRAKEFKTYYMRKKRWKFRGRLDAEF